MRASLHGWNGMRSWCDLPAPTQSSRQAGLRYENECPIGRFPHKTSCETFHHYDGAGSGPCQGGAPAGRREWLAHPPCRTVARMPGMAPGRMPWARKRGRIGHARLRRRSLVHVTAAYPGGRFATSPVQGWSFAVFLAGPSGYQVFARRHLCRTAPGSPVISGQPLTHHSGQRHGLPRPIPPLHMSGFPLHDQHSGHRPA